MSFVLQLTEDQAQALFRMPEEIASLKEQIQSVANENMELRLGLQHYTKAETASLLRVSEDTLWRYAKNGKLVPQDFGGSVRYSGADILAFSRRYKLGVKETDLADVLPKKNRENKRITA